MAHALTDQLIEKGRASGKVTTTEINDMMEKMGLDADALGDIVEQLHEANIEIIDDYDPNAALDLNDPALLGAGDILFVKAVHLLGSD